MEDVQHLIQRILFHSIGSDLVVREIRVQSGGCINMSVRVDTNRGVFFVKWNELELQDLFEKEVDGLKFLKGKSSLVIPEVIALGQVEDKVYLVLEFLERDSSNTGQIAFGEGLAELHDNSSKMCGYTSSNYIGKLPQNNTYCKSWIEFYRERRLNVQLGLAIYEGRVDQAFVDDFKSFLSKLDQIIPESSPSLLHGDLWSGNVMIMNHGAAIFDPAIYFGAPEMDLAMTRLFGGFDEGFYQAYLANTQLNDDFEQLEDVYNLYPLMVHVNLFGAESGYLSAVKRIISRYL